MEWFICFFTSIKLKGKCDYMQELVRRNNRMMETEVFSIGELVEIGFVAW